MDRLKLISAQQAKTACAFKNTKEKLHRTFVSLLRV